MRARSIGAQTAKVAILRMEQEDSYLLEAVFLDAEGERLGHLTTDLEVSYDAAGQLLNGQLRVRPACTGTETFGCTDLAGPSELELVKPVFRDTSLPSTNIKVTSSGDPGSPDDGRRTQAVSWTELLEGTTWRTALE